MTEATTDDIAAQNAALREVLRAILAVMPTHTYRFEDCAYCDGEGGARNTVCTNPDCPGVKARALLAEIYGTPMEPTKGIA